MQEPICRKCSGHLEKSQETNLWICNKCRRIYIYDDPAPNAEQIKLSEINGILDGLTYCARQAMHDIGKLMGVMTELDQQTVCYLRRNGGIEFVLSECERSYKLLHDFTQGTKELIKDMEVRFTSIGGGHFEEFHIE